MMKMDDMTDLNETYKISSKSIYPNDLCVKIITNDENSGFQKEEHIMANRASLAASSPYLKHLIINSIMVKVNALPVLPTIQLNFGSTPGAAQAFESILHFLYTGELVTHSAELRKILEIARLCQMNSVEWKISVMLMQQRPTPLKFPTISGFLPLVPLVPQSLTDINWLFAMRYFQTNGSSSSLPLSSFQPFNSVVTNQGTPQMINNCQQNYQETTKFIRQNTISSRSSSIDRSLSTSDDNITNSEASSIECTTIIVPSNDKEGWCRNKKYIEKVGNGFMCTVCRKVYGRYNSVSYHVTIYHRNPPIKCDEDGCQFTTREARYIHFHKYYRHRIPLPESIDLGSRKCPFCRHVSKSPAMLEKHINRHIPHSTRPSRLNSCSECVNNPAGQLDNLLNNDSLLQCKECSYRGRTEHSLDQHKLFKHSQDFFKKNLQCSECSFRCTSDERLSEHSQKMHQTITTSEDEACIPLRKVDERMTDKQHPFVLQNPLERPKFQEEPMCLITRKSIL